MIDCHTHLWRVGEHVGPQFLEAARRAWGATPEAVDVSPERHTAAMAGVDAAIVLGFHAPYADVVVPNDYVADYCARNPTRWCGFASVNPVAPGAREELERCHQDLSLSGLKLGPVYQNYDPTDERGFPVYEYCQRHRIPILIHQATTFPPQAPLRYALPILLDEVAIRFPDLVMVLAHLGHPWEAECAVTIRKHPNLYADISGLHGRPWRFYQALITCVEYGVADKLLFGSDFPFFTPEATAEGLRRVNQIVEGTPMPKVPAVVIDGILERNPLPVLGLSG
ncbi:MAG: amidohydrolase [Armatimonadetes bacterium]|nr:amidohydrolase [Armatimonadota bacterium]